MMTNLSTRRPRHAGFTILELALTLAILAVLSVGILVPFVAQVSQRNIANTERILEQAKEALLGYAIVNGRLPCPATDTSKGKESVSNPATGLCTSFFGYLPAATLGFTPIDSEGYALDGWGTRLNRIRYAVSDHNGANTFTLAGGMKSAGPSAFDVPLIFVCSSASGVNAATPTCGAGASVQLTNGAPVVIWSVGANALSAGASADEEQNAFPGALSGGAVDRLYVSHGINSKPGSEFDDIVTWLSVGNLVSRMVLAGALP